jgi:outer membrane immunogenic protein
MKVNRFMLRSCVLVFALVAAGFGQNWKGFYVGANAGGFKGNTDAFTSTVFSPTGYFALSSVPAIAATGHQLLSPRGFSGGGTVGYNFQGGHWVVGFEADFGSMHVNDDFTSTGVYPCCAPTNFTITQKVSSDWLLTARPRVGITNGPVLLYGTFGLAMTNFDYKEDFIDTFATAHESARTSGTLTGWSGGGGVEFKLGSGNHWSMKGEYLWNDFGTGVKTTSTNLTAFGPPVIPFPTNVFTHQADMAGHLFRAGFNYRF